MNTDTHNEIPPIAETDSHQGRMIRANRARRARREKKLRSASVEFPRANIRNGQAHFEYHCERLRRQFTHYIKSSAVNNVEALAEALNRLADASATVGNLDHAGAVIPADAWAEMYAANNQARAALAKYEATQ